MVTMATPGAAVPGMGARHFNKGVVMGGHALIAGGSIGGLFAATALQAQGWSVEVFERSDVELAGRGAGIVTHPELIAALQTVGAPVEGLGVEVTERVAFDLNGDRVAEMPYHQIVTSWTRLHQLLRALVPDGAYHLGRHALSYEHDGDGVRLSFADGTTARGDLLVGADGFRSSVRAQMLPEVQPTYAGYVVWRALAKETDLSPGVHQRIFAPFGFFLPRDTQIIGYPIAGPGNDLRPGHRQYNFVWYSAAPRAALDDMLTDTAGHRHAISIPPPLVRKQVLEAMMEDARARLSAPFVDVLARGERPFFTPIYDHHSPVMAAGRAALVGDAACVARPHVGMGVTKAALDALTLARCMSEGDVPPALQAYSEERVPAARAAYDRAQHLGRLIFEAGGAELNRDGRRHPDMEQIMRDTAVAI